MLARRAGHIVVVSSVMGYVGTPGRSTYAAAKHALEGLSASLAQELAPLGIRVTAVAPGAFRTEFLSAQSIQKSAAEDAAYAATVGRMTAAFDSMNGRQKGDPDRAAQALLALADAPEPPVHLLLGSDALQRAREKQGAVAGEMERWEALTRSTDF